jgi:DNA-binding NarL/FixJ family response regulator
MKVLLVEENSAVRGVIRQLVTSPGTCIQECVDSTDAISAYAASRPDFVIMDVGMKDLDGIAVSKQIKAMDPAARIVLVSDYDDSGMRESARRAGACGYVLKDNLLEVTGLLRAFSARDEKSEGANASTMKTQPESL